VGVAGAAVAGCRACGLERSHEDSEYLSKMIDAINWIQTTYNPFHLKCPNPRHRPSH
jgi:hypothetical protein